MLLVGASTLAIACSESETTPEPTTGGADDAIVQAIQSSDRYLVAFKPGAASAGRAAVAAKGQILLDITGVDAVAAQLPDAAVAGLQNNPNISIVEKDPLRKPTATPEPGTVPYGISMVQADQMSDANAGNRTVCIIDSGYDMGHESLPGSTTVSGNDADPNAWNVDGCGHGTHVAGTIAGLGTNVVGANPSGNLKLHIEKVFGNDCGWAYASELINAAYACRDAGANVISMSLGCASGGPWCYSSVEDQGFQGLYDQGILSVAAASNDGKGWYSYPASYSSVISVAAVDSNGQHAYFSNTNDAVELAAPGVNILSTVPQGCALCDDATNLYEYWNGTSMATPHVAGVAALLWSHDTTLSNAQIREALQQSAKDLGSAGRDNDTGYGLVQAQAAFTLLGLGSTEPACSTDTDCATGICCDGACVAPACTSDTGCDDGNECTTDTCSNAGTCGAACESAPVADDTTCGTDGVCCSGSCSTPTCSTDTDCGDGDACTADTCYSGATCGAYCTNAAIETCEPACETTELSCTDGVDNDCDGSVDEDDECTTTTCIPVGDVCASDAECCTNKCRGKPGAMTCK